MATKNLARTAIEGGRTGSNKWDRRYSHAETRADEKAYLGEVKKDIENFYDYDIPKTRTVYKEFNDKLGPMYRWLQCQVGLPWDEVRSLVTKAFDTRTTAGRHIVYDHLLRQVEVTPNYNYGGYRYGLEDYTTSYSYHDYYVDDAGILRMKTYIRRKDKNKTPYFNTAQIANWLSGRVVGKVGKRLFWFVPTGKNKKHRGSSEVQQWITQWGYAGKTYYSNYGLNYFYLRKDVVYKYDNGVLVYENEKPVILEYKTSWQNATPTFRQDRKLNEKELAFWNTIPVNYQTSVLEYSPTYDGPPRKERRYY